MLPAVSGWSLRSDGQVRGCFWGWPKGGNVKMGLLQVLSCGSLVLFGQSFCRYFFTPGTKTRFAQAKGLASKTIGSVGIVVPPIIFFRRTLKLASLRQSVRLQKTIGVREMAVLSMIFQSVTGKRRGSVCLCFAERLTDEEIALHFPEQRRYNSFR